MIVTVDARETALIDELRDNPIKSLAEYLTPVRKCGIVLETDDDQQYNSTEPTPNLNSRTTTIVCSRPNHTLNVSRLALGDATLSVADTDDATNLIDVLLFERKTLADFAASIRDGRYKEQSFRLNKHCELPNHSIIYIIEGDLSKYVDRSKGGNIITKKALYSAMFSTMFYKGFSIIRTMNIRETAELILNFADKYDSTASELRGFHYRSPHQQSPHQQSPHQQSPHQQSPHQLPVRDATVGDEYASVLKRKERSSQITPDNIGEIMLTAVPCVSSKTAAAIMHEFKTIANLLACMKLDRQCLDKLAIVAQNGNARKISKICVENIFKYLLV